MRSFTTVALGALALAALVHAQSACGQTAAPKEPKRAPLASPADVEPAVDVSEPRVALIDAPPFVPAAPPAAAPEASSPPGAAGQKSTQPPRSAPVPPTASANAPSAAVAGVSSKPPAAPGAQSKSPAAPAPNSRAMDTLDLGTTSITGNQELPKVLYIVPWKKSDLGDLVGRPVNTLLDEVLEPVDPEVFQRHLSYYDALYGKGQKGKE
jgi:hypothetical protein